METEKSAFNAGIKYSEMFVDLLKVCIISADKKDAFTWLSALNSMFYALSKKKMTKDQIVYCKASVEALQKEVFEGQKLQVGTMPFILYKKLSQYQQELVTIADEAGLLTMNQDQNSNLLR